MATRATPGATAAALLEAEALSSETEPRRAVRIMAHAVGVALGVAPHALGRVYGDKFHMREAVRVLDRAKIDLGCESTVRVDLPIAEAKVKARVKILVSPPGFIGALAVDGATFKYDHAIAIMLLSHQLEDPVLLRLMYPKHDGPYTAARLAVDLKKVLAEYELPLARIACVMGDNVTFNASLAKKPACHWGSASRIRSTWL